MGARVFPHPHFSKDAIPARGRASKKVLRGDGPFGVAEDPDRLGRCRHLGIARVVVSFPSVATDQELPILDRWTALISRTEPKMTTARA